MVDIVELMVDPKDVDATANKLAQAFTDKHNVGLQDYELIVYPEFGGLKWPAIRNALKAHLEHCQNLAAVSITGVDPCKMHDTIRFQEKDHTFEQIILNTLRDSEGKLFFSSIEPTRKSETEGTHLLVTTKDRLEEAQTAIDIVLELLDQYHAHEIKLDGKRLSRTYRREGPAADYSAQLNATYQPKSTPTPRNQLWNERRNKRPPQFTVQNFPNMSPGRQPSPAKKQKPQQQPQPTAWNAQDQPHQPTQTQPDDSTIGSMTDEMEEKIQASESRITTILEEKVSAGENRIHDSLTQKLNDLKLVQQQRFDAHKESVDQLLNGILENQTVDAEQNQRRDAQMDILTKIIIKMYNVQATALGTDPLSRDDIAALLDFDTDPTTRGPKGHPKDDRSRKRGPHDDADMSIEYPDDSESNRTRGWPHRRVRLRRINVSKGTCWWRSRRGASQHTPQ